MPDNERARGVTEAVMAALRDEDYWDAREITARAMFAVISGTVPGLTREQLPAVTMALGAAEGAGLITKQAGRKGKRNVWRLTRRLRARTPPRRFREEQAAVVPARAQEVQVPLSAVEHYLPADHPLRRAKGGA